MFSTGLIADLTGSYKYAFYIAASLEIVGGCLSFLARFIPSLDNDHTALQLQTELVVVEKETVL